VKFDIASAIAKTLLAAVSAPVVMTSPVFPHDFTTPYIGVPFNVVIACSIGTYASFAWGDTVKPRAHALRLGISCLAIGCAVTALVNAGLDEWTSLKLTDGVQAGLGAVCSVLMRFVIPEVIKRIGPWMDKIPLLRKKGE
jgi:hypothetical protein